MTTTITLSSEVKNLVEDLFPDFSHDDQVLLEAGIHGILEGKDIGKFKGDISFYKERAINTAARMPRPVVSRRGIEKAAGKELDKLVNKLEREMLLHLSRLRSDDPSRKISPSQFTKRMKASLRLAYKVAYDFGTFASGLGRANKDIVTHAGADEKQWLDKMFAQEQVYFNKFLDSLIKGESWKKARVRIKNYSNAIRSIYESSRVLQLPDNVVLHWVLQSSNPCLDCRLLHRLSPFTKFTLPTTPKAGSTRCLSYCYCKIRVVSAKPSEVQRVARKNKSAAATLRKLKQNRKKKKN